MAYKIGPYCMCCHNCKTVCPVGAPHIVHTSYEIDPEKCIGCGRCAAVCHISAIYNEADPPQSAPSHAPVELDADLVVLGGGISGLIAAVRAAEQTGRRVVVLERAKKTGGNAWYAHDFTKFGSRWERESGQPDIRDRAVNTYINHMEYKLDPKLIRNAVYGTGEFFDWLVDLDPEEAAKCFKMLPSREVWFNPIGSGIRLTPNWVERIDENLGCRDAAIGPGMAGYYVIKKMRQQLDRYGIRVLTETRARRILLDEGGAFAGVVAEDPGGEVRVRAKACVVATGGWARNDALIQTLYPWFEGREPGSEPVHRFAIPTTTGDVLELAESCGAATDVDNMWMNIFGPVHHPFSFSLFRTCTQPELVFVNMDGRRFIDESRFTNGCWVLDKQPRRQFYAIVDEETLDFLMQRQAGDPDPNAAADRWLFDSYRLDVEEELAQGTALHRADSFADLAEAIGVDPAALTKTMEDYNRYCAQGRDEQFYKPVELLRPVAKPPYYAIYAKTATDGAFGGVKIDGDCRVVRPDGGAIPGLFASGDNAAGWGFRKPGPGDHRSFILSELTWAASSGWICGNRAADYLRV